MQSALRLLRDAGGRPASGTSSVAANRSAMYWPIRPRPRRPAAGSNVSWRARAFAETELGLPASKSYREYADLGRPYVVWNVVATPEFSVEPLRWCFPVAGCVAYRGYFDEAARASTGAQACRCAAMTSPSAASAPTRRSATCRTRCSARCWAGARRGSSARSSTNSRTSSCTSPGDSEFNEAFASVVEEEGVRRWLLASGARGGPRRRSTMAASAGGGVRGPAARCARAARAALRVPACRATTMRDREAARVRAAQVRVRAVARTVGRLRRVRRLVRAARSTTRTWRRSPPIATACPACAANWSAPARCRPSTNEAEVRRAPASRRVAASRGRTARLRCQVRRAAAGR